MQEISPLSGAIVCLTQHLDNVSPGLCTRAEGPYQASLSSYLSTVLPDEIWLQGPRKKTFFLRTPEVLQRGSYYSYTKAL